MLKFALFCPFKLHESKIYVEEIINNIIENNHYLMVDENLESIAKKQVGSQVDIFDKEVDLVAKGIDYFISIGGDGTLLQSIIYVKDTNIPIIGINVGRLGFLTSFQKKAIKEGMGNIYNKDYNIIKRSLFQIKAPSSIQPLMKFPYALNEVAFNREHTTSLISIHIELNNKFLTTYWADGLIIATATGSTGYSLSSGGPILSPETKGIVLTPISPHNLNVRPLVIPEETELKIIIKGNAKKYSFSMDSRIFSIENNKEFIIKKAPFVISTIEFKNEDFYKKLKGKLLWGVDNRNMTI